MEYMTGVSNPDEYMKMRVEERMKKTNQSKMMQDVNKMLDIEIKEEKKIMSNIFNTPKNN